jgi:hypothetical protein
MQLEVQDPSFKTQRLSVQTASWLGGPQLLLNGTRAQKTKRRYLVKDDSGAETTIQLNYNFLDPIPKVKIGEKIVELASPLKWYEYVWIGIPFILVFTGGALGGLIGALSANASGKIFRGNRSLLAKYSLSALISFGGLITFIIAVTAFRHLLGVPHI